MPINPSFISSHLSPSLTSVFYSPYFTPFRGARFPPLGSFPHTQFSLPGFPHLEFQDVHLSYRPSKTRGDGWISTRWTHGRAHGIFSKILFWWTVLGGGKIFPQHKFDFY